MEMVILMAILVFFAFGLVIEKIIRKARLYRYEEIEIGMSEDEVIDLMGFHYSQSLLSRGRTKYEWKVNGSMFLNNGIFHFIPTKSVEVYVKGGEVYKVLSHNM